MAGKRIIVTGAANGIGAHIVHYLARNLSARISVIDRDSTALKLFEQRLLKGSDPALKSEDLLFIECDVSSEHSVKSAVAKTISTFGGIDGLVNNAGISTPYGSGKKTRLEDWSTEEFDGYLKTNLTGAFMFCRECAGELEKAKGAIVNIASSRAAQSEPLSEGESSQLELTRYDRLRLSVFMCILT
jgi:NAD(P)-dependent dehydrogenase (short-subunit alcohol dehydrogenase family)